MLKAKDKNLVLPKYLQIPVLHEFSPELFQNIFLTLEQPVILRNFSPINNWPIFNWSLERIADEFGESSSSPRINFPRSDDFSVNPFTLVYEEYPAKTEMSVKEFIKRVKDPETAVSPCYLQPGAESNALLEKMTNGQVAFNFDDIVLPPPNSEPSTTNLWIGSAGTRAGFHQDDRNNFIVILEGKKLVYLASPYYTSSLYPFPGIPDKSQVAPENYDPKLFPNMSKVTFLKGVIEKGDILFLPRGWWHTLKAHEPTMMLNYWYGSPLTKDEFKLMYDSLDFKYKLAVKKEFIRIFFKTCKNIFSNKSPIAGLSVWYTPGTEAAINMVNWFRKYKYYFLQKLRKKPVPITFVERPFYYR